MSFSSATLFFRIWLRALLTLWLTATIIFFLLRVIPGDAITAQYLEAGLSSEEIEERKEQLGLNESFLNQYAHYLVGLLRLDLGQSLYTGHAVNNMIAQRLPNTLQLGGLAAILSVTLGSLWGGLIAFSGLPLLRAVTQFLITLSLSVPVYWTATLVAFVFAVQLGISWNATWIPVCVLGFHTAGAIAQVVAFKLNDTSSALFVRTAQAKGLRRQSIIIKHVLRPSLPVIVSVVALQTGLLLSGTVITEMIFLRPGLGTLVVRAVIDQDFPVVQGVSLLVAAVFVTLNSLVDFLNSFIDPRMRSY